MLVARREFSERIRQRAFQISTAVSLLVVAAVAVLAGVLGDDGPKSYKVGVQGPEAAAIVRTAQAVESQFDVRIEERRFAGAAEARAAVRDEDVEVAVVDGALVAREDPPDELAQAIQAGARQVRAEGLLREQGVERRGGAPRARPAAAEGADPRRTTMTTAGRASPSRRRSSCTAS